MGVNRFGLWGFSVPVQDEGLILGGAFLLVLLNLPLHVLILNFRRNVAERGRKIVVRPLGFIRICSAVQFNDLGTTNLWTTNLPAPVLGNGQNTVTNPITGTQQFFRLSR